MTYYFQDKFTTNQVAAAIAAAMLRDLRINGFSFRGFPSVLIERVGENFDVHISCNGKTVGPLSIPFTIAKEQAWKFKKGEEMDAELFEKVQDLLIKLEGATSS